MSNNTQQESPPRNVQADPQKLFKLLTDKMASDKTIAQRINAHVRERTGHSTVVNFFQNGSSDQDKIGLIVECLVAINKNDFSGLKGQSRWETKAKNLLRAAAGPSEEEEQQEEESEVSDQSEEQAEPEPPQPAMAVVDDESPDLQQALAILGQALRKPKKVEINEQRVIEILKKDGPALLKNEILNWLKVPMAEIDTKLTDAMGKFNRAELETVVITALQSVVGKKVTDGLQSGDLEIIPPVQAADKTYVRNAVSLKIERAIDKLHNVIVSGPSGSGKTYPIEQELRIKNKRYIGPISIAAGITKKDMLAREWLQTTDKGVVTKWVYGFVVKAMQHGLPLILDEISMLEGEMLGHLYYAGEYGTLHLPETGEIINAKQGFQIFGTDNSLTDDTGLYSGHRMSIALTNRFRYIYSDYMEAAEEIEVFEKHGVNNKTAGEIRTFLEGCRKLYYDGTLTFAPSTRVGKNIALEIADGLKFDEAVAYCLTDSLPPSDKTKVVALI